jgi:hypothetical protein
MMIDRPVAGGLEQRRHDVPALSPESPLPTAPSPHPPTLRPRRAFQGYVHIIIQVVYDFQGVV